MNKRCEIQEDEYSEFINNKAGDSPVVLEIGAGLDVPTIRYHAENVIRNFKNGFLIRINPNECLVRTRGVGLPMSALDALSLLEENLLK